jgi:hypothetical protein
VQQSAQRLEMFKKNPAHAELFKDVAIDVLVGTKQFWQSACLQSNSINAQKQIVFPAQLQKLQSRFTKFCCDNFAFHDMEWSSEYGEAEIEIRFEENNKNSHKTLCCSTRTMLVLCAFHQQKMVSFAQILTLTDLPDFAVRNIITNLVVMKVLSMRNNTAKSSEDFAKSMQATDVFRFNPSYFSAQNSVKRAVVVDKQYIKNSSDQSLEKEAIALEAKKVLAVKGAIVRIMKSEQSLSHEHLYTKVITTLSESTFWASERHFKTALDQCLLEDMIERDAIHRHKYKYINLQM